MMFWPRFKVTICDLEEVVAICARLAAGSFKVTICDLKSVASSAVSEMESEVLRKTIHIALHRLVQHLGRNTVEAGEIGVEDDGPVTQIENGNRGHVKSMHA